MDEWRCKKTCHYSHLGELTYVHAIELVSRNDGRHTPLDALIHLEPSNRTVMHIFRLGERKNVYVTQEVLQITYFAPKGRDGCDVHSDLMRHIEDNEDLELQASNGAIFRTNKFLLEARSSVFRAMFSHDTKEAQSNRIEFEDVSSSALEDLVCFLKTDRVPNIEINAIELGFIAEKFDFPHLFRIVEKYLEKNINESNYPRVSLLAHSSNSRILHRALGRSQFVLDTFVKGGPRLFLPRK